MTDDQHLDLIDDAFADFRSGGPIGVPLGVEAVRGTVRRRRTARTITAAALAALVVAVPVAVAAANDRDSNAPPVPAVSGELTPTATEPAPTSAAPSAPASSAGAPDGRINDPANATLPMPTWPVFPGFTCLGGSLTFVKGKAGGNTINLMKTVHVDVDADGALETVVILRCSPGQTVAEMAVAYEKGADGKAVLIGKVMQNAPTGLMRLDDLRADGTRVQIRVGDRATCCGMPASTTQWQWRTYGWTGTAFEQTAGPTTFPPNPHITDLGVTAPAELLLTKDPDRTDPQGFFGEITFTVRNFGPVPTGAEGRFAFNMTNRMTVISPPASCKQEDTVLYCPISLAVGESKTVTLKLSAVSSLVGPWNEKTSVTVAMAPSLTDPDTYYDLDSEQSGHVDTVRTLITEIH